MINFWEAGFLVRYRSNLQYVSILVVRHQKGVGF